MPLREDLTAIEQTFKQLQLEWEKFFGGVERRPPTVLRTKLEALIRTYADVEIRNSGDRFRYQGLVGRYNVFSEMWNKRLRAMEEGRVGPAAMVRLPGGHTADLVATMPTAPPSRMVTERLSYRVEGGGADAAAIRDLYEAFARRREQLGEKAPTFDAFERQIAQTTAKMAGGQGARAVDYRVETEGGKVTLKARAIK